MKSLAQIVFEQREAEMRARPEARNRDLGKWEPRKLRPARKKKHGRQPTLMPEQEERAVRLFLSGMTREEVALELQTTTCTIRSVMRRRGVQQKGHAGCGRYQRQTRALLERQR